VTQFTWTGAGPTGVEWGDSGNWSPKDVPESDPDNTVIVIPDRDAAGNPDGVYDVPPGFQAKALILGQCGLLSGGPITVTDLEWTSGPSAAGIVVNGRGVISSSGGPNGGSYVNPTLLNNAVLTNNGTITVTGSGDFFCVGGGSTALVNNGTVELTGPGGIEANVLWLSGDGTVSVTGSSHIWGQGAFDWSMTGPLTISKGARLLLYGYATVHLRGGTLSGDGTLTIGSGTGSGGYLSVEKATAIAAGPVLELAAGGTLQPPAGQSAASSPAVSLAGDLLLSGGSVQADVHLTPTATCVVSGGPSLSFATLDNQGVLTVESGSFLDMYNGVLRNRGRLVLSGSADLGNIVTGGSSVWLSNEGLIEKTGVGTAHIVGPAMINGYASTGNIDISGGTLDLLEGAVLTISGGTLSLRGGDIGSSDGSGTIAITGGTSGGRLAGSGTVGAAVANGGWVEPGAAKPLAFTGGYSQSQQGSIALPAAALTAAQPLLSLPGGAVLAGSLWITP
jgi:hypothetical protein